MRLALALLLVLAGCRQLLGLDRPALAATDAPAAPSPDVLVDTPMLPRDTGATGSIAVTAVALNPGDIQLTTEGTTDWAHWGFANARGFDHKASGGGLISNATATATATIMQINNVAVTATWTDGTPDAAESATGTGIAVTGGFGLSFTVPADSTARALHVYIGCARCTGRLDAALSDASVASYSDDQFSSTAAIHAEYTIVFADELPGTTLTVTWSDEASLAAGDFAELLSATLE